MREALWLSGRDERHALRLRVDGGRDVSESVTLQEEPAAAGAARRFTARICRESGVSVESSELAVLLVSEVVANAATHGHSRPRLNVTTARHGVRVEVGDMCDAPAVLRAAHLDDDSGRGLAMLATCASEWGVRPKRRGKVVWFEIVDPRPE